MALNPSIILAGTQPDFVNVLRQSNAGAQEANQTRQQNALRQLYQEQGQGIAQGDPNALNALARFDPQAALGVKQSMAGERRADAQLGMQERGLDMREQEFGMRVKEYAAGISAQQAAAEAEQIKRGIFAASAANSPEQWDQVVTQFGQPELAGQFENKDALLTQYMTAAQILEANKAPEAPASIQALRIRAQEAGMKPGTPEYAEFMAKGGKPDKGMQISSDGKGGFTFTQGDGVGGNDPADVSNPSSPGAMSATIDGILNDPALDTSTGMLSFMQNVPGTPQYRFGTRSNQLEGQAFLQAFESLKGAGQITEIEGTKATQAIGRLDTAQSPKDYRQALTELNDILKDAAGRPVGWAEQQSATPADVPNISDEAGYNALPSGTVFTAPDGTQRRKP